MLNAGTMDINFEDFEPIMEPRRRLSGSAVNISPAGNVSLNARLQAEIRERADAFRLGFSIHKKDRRILILWITEKPNYTFSANGGKTDREFSRFLVENGVALPARYEVTWNERASVWVGVLHGELLPDAKEQSVRAARRKTKRAGS